VTVTEHHAVNQIVQANATAVLWRTLVAFAEDMAKRVHPIFALTALSTVMESVTVRQVKILAAFVMVMDRLAFVRMGLLTVKELVMVYMSMMNAVYVVVLVHRVLKHSVKMV
jgi:hypothetical protein